MKNLFKPALTGLSGISLSMFIPKVILGLFFIFAIYPSLAGQPDPAVEQCISRCGPDAKYVKDYRVQLGRGIPSDEFRFRANFSLRKNTTYRFTMCTDRNSGGELVFRLLNEENEVVASSPDNKTGIADSSIEMTCRKSGIYLLCYDFTQRQAGSGTGIVSVILR
jgi:hypothetical protein